MMREVIMQRQGTKFQEKDLKVNNFIKTVNFNFWEFLIYMLSEKPIIKQLMLQWDKILDFIYNYLNQNGMNISLQFYVEPQI